MLTLIILAGLASSYYWHQFPKSEVILTMITVEFLLILYDNLNKGR